MKQFYYVLNNTQSPYYKTITTKLVLFYKNTLLLNYIKNKQHTNGRGPSRPSLYSSICFILEEPSDRRTRVVLSLMFKFLLAWSISI
ncbi:hypothetical protein QTP88_022651 [Uroleucon formosanum]